MSFQSLKLFSSLFERLLKVLFEVLFEVLLELFFEVLVEVLLELHGDVVARTAAELRFNLRGIEVEVEMEVEIGIPLRRPSQAASAASASAPGLVSAAGRRLRRLRQRRSLLAAALTLVFAAGDRLARQDDVAAERLQFDAGAAAAEREVEALAAAARVLPIGQLHREVRREVALERAHEDRRVVGAA